ncbi:hypothetical protein [Maricaulis maris]|uniref:DUF6898 domain-containing protein n=1 Tax=Maricaulis maris (strain MCS10) TaxID=394221 RepID=Q0APF6_MARMM|nr:hypothetical protein [Maricaulis maris]ABI65831.1 hypothetical protein Mmar10_1539 [Maricaulis maris MCS10]
MPGEIFVEIQKVGNALRVAAIDGATAEEVVFQVPARTPRADIDTLARAKLAWKLKRCAANEKRPSKGPGRRGIEV